MSAFSPLRGFKSFRSALFLVFKCWSCSFLCVHYAQITTLLAQVEVSEVSEPGMANLPFSRFTVVSKSLLTLLSDLMICRFIKRTNTCSERGHWDESIDAICVRNTKFKLVLYVICGKTIFLKTGVTIKTPRCWISIVRKTMKLLRVYILWKPCNAKASPK